MQAVNASLDSFYLQRQVLLKPVTATDHYIIIAENVKLGANTDFGGHSRSL